jgi:hypothetical protein
MVRIRRGKIVGDGEGAKVADAASATGEVR